MNEPRPSLEEHLNNSVEESKITLLFFENQISGITRLLSIFDENRDFFDGRAGQNILDIIADKLEEILSE